MQNMGFANNLPPIGIRIFKHANKHQDVNENEFKYCLIRDDAGKISTQAVFTYSN